MKKTVSVNLNGRVFTMDEDAYQLLDIYLQNLRMHFKKEEGATEIMADFEARIEELFGEKLQAGHTVITFAEVEAVISRMGKPVDFATEDEAETPPAAPETKTARKKLFRNMHDKVIGGVCSGIAAYFGWNVRLVRLISVVLIFIPRPFVVLYNNAVTDGFPFGRHSGSIPFMVLAYLIAWIVIPKARTVAERLQMRGEPVTVENIGKTVSAQAAPPELQSQNNGCLSVIGALMKVGLIVIGALVVLPILFALGAVAMALFGVLFGVSGGLFGVLGSVLIGESAVMAVNMPVMAMVSLVIIVGIPLVAAIYWLIAAIAKLKPVSLTLRRVFPAIWLIALVLLFCSGIHFNRTGSAIDRVGSAIERTSRAITKTGWRKSHWWNNISYEVTTNGEQIEGNGRLSERQVDFSDPISTLRLGKNLVARVKIEQTDSDTTTIVFNGDENLLENILADRNGERLELSGKISVRGKHNINVTIRTPRLTRIEQHSVGVISVLGLFAADTLVVEMKGVGNIGIDSLRAKLLKVNSDGVGAVEVVGEVQKALLEVKGLGGINAIELVADSVEAHVKGLATIACNPVMYLNASVKGIGSVTYKNRPPHVITTNLGLGHIGKE